MDGILVCCLFLFFSFFSSFLFFFFFFFFFFFKWKIGRSDGLKDNGGKSLVDTVIIMDKNRM